MRVFVTMMMVLVLAGCQIEGAGSGTVPSGEGTNVENAGFSTPAGEEAARKQCQASGGRFGQGGFAGPACVHATPDAGKTCSQASDCSGFCLADSRTCSPETPFFGCHKLLMGQGHVAELCVD